VIGGVAIARHAFSGAPYAGATAGYSPPRAAVLRIGSPLDVAQALEVGDEVDDGRLAHLGELGQLGEARPLVPDVLADRPVRGAEVGEAAFGQSLAHEFVHGECRVAQQPAVEAARTTGAQGAGIP
jgi:hypothetical protein